MQDKIIRDLRSVFSDHSFTETTLTETPLHIYETNGIDESGYSIKFTVMTNAEPEERTFKITNLEEENKVTHICIDGDFIRYGQYKYDKNSPERTDRRPDCIVFDDKTFLFVELKLEQKEISFGKEDTKWKKLLEGANQILDFVNFLRAKGFNVADYYSQISAVICMRFEPNFSILSRGNSRRNGERLKLSNRLGFPILAQNYFEFNTD
jgi:hypothetical protein